jgi:hypothetical protein
MVVVPFDIEIYTVNSWSISDHWVNWSSELKSHLSRLDIELSKTTSE